MTSFFTILLRGIGLGLSDAIRYSFTLLVGQQSWMPSKSSANQEISFRLFVA